MANSFLQSATKVFHRHRRLLIMQDVACSEFHQVHRNLFVLLASLKSFLGAEPPHSDVTGAPTQPIINGISEHCEKQCSLLPAVLECTNNKKEEVASSRRWRKNMGCIMLRNLVHHIGRVMLVRPESLGEMSNAAAHCPPIRMSSESSGEIYGVNVLHS